MNRTIPAHRSRVTVKYAAAEALRLIRRNNPGDIAKAEGLLSMAVTDRGENVPVPNGGTKESAIVRQYESRLAQTGVNACVAKRGGLYYVHVFSENARFVALGAYTLDDITRLSKNLTSGIGWVGSGSFHARHCIESSDRQTTFRLMD